MGIITRAINKANLNPQLEGATTPGMQNWQDLVPLMYTAMGYFGYQPPQTFYQLVNSLSSWEFIVDDKIARTIASLPIKIRAMQKKSSRKFLPASEAVYHKTSMQKMDRIKKHYYLKDAGIEVVEITDHPFYDLMRTPNPVDVRFTFMYATAMRLELAGMCGWYKVRGKNGLPMELWPLPLTWTGELKPVPDTKTIIAGYLYLDGNIRETFKLDEILFFKLPHLKGPWEGMSAIKSQMYPYSIDDQQQKQVYNIFKNQAMFGNVFSTDKDLQTQQITDIHAQLSATYQGAKNAGKALVLHSGLKQGKGLQTSFRDLMLDVVNENVRDKMLSSHSISPSNVGMTKSSNRANMESAQESFYTDCITPRLMLIEEHIEQKLLTEYDDGFTCDFELPAFEDANEKRQQEDSDIKNMVMMPNEVRLARGLQSDPTLEGVWFVPNTMVALKDGKVDEALSPPKPVPVPFGGQPKPGGEVPPVKPGQEQKEPGKPAAGAVEPAKEPNKGGPGSGRHPEGGEGAEKTARAWKKVEAGDIVSGLVVGSHIPNQDSISATLNDYETIGVREVPMDIFSLQPGNEPLANEIRESGRIDPLIVVVDGHPDGMAYILEGSHRIDALKYLGVKSFPALVVLDKEGLEKNGKKATKGGPGSGRHPEGLSKDVHLKISQRQSSELNENQHGAINQYNMTGPVMNKDLRNGKSSDLAKRLDGAFEKTSGLAGDVELYRIVGDPIFIPKEGGSFVDKGFCSTTIDLKTASSLKGQLPGMSNKATIIKIVAPQGAKALCINNGLGLSRFHGEQEVLLPRGCKFDVVKNDGKNIELRIKQ